VLPLSSGTADASRVARRVAPARLTSELLRALGKSSDVADAAAFMAAAAEQRHVRAGTVIFSRADTADALWLISRGKVAVGVLGSRGMLLHSRTLRAGEWINVASAILRGPHVEDAVAETDVLLLRLPIDAVHACAAAHPDLAWVLATLAAERVRELTGDAHRLVRRSALTRCALWLLEQAERGTARGDSLATQVALHQPKRSVALQLGTSPETFSRMLRQLSRDGLIVVRGAVIDVLDLAGLRRASEAD